MLKSNVTLVTYECHKNSIQENNIQYNGILLNGIEENSRILNGIKLNAIPENGIQVNGIKLNSIQENGVQENGPSSYLAQVRTLPRYVFSLSPYLPQVRT